MKVSVKKVDALRREMSFEVPKERVAEKMAAVLKDISKHAHIDGFRKGKAPRKLVEAAHAKTAREEALKNLIPEVYQEGVRQEKLDPIDYPAIDQVDMGEAGLKFRATFDIRPTVEIKDYKGIKVSRKPSEVTEEELSKTLEYFKKGRGLDEKAELDDAFAKSMSFPSVDEFKKAIKRNMEFDKERQNRADVENQVVEELLKRAKLDIPASLVARQLEGRTEEFQRRMKQYRVKEEEMAKKLEEAAKDLKEAAEKDVRLFFILQEIGKKENVELKEGESIGAKVMEFLLKEAKWEEVK